MVEPPAPEIAPYRYQFSADLSLASAVQYFDALTFPRLSQEARFNAIRQPLTAVLVSQGGQNAGLILAEPQAEGGGVMIRSMFVVPDQRRKGLARHLLHVLARELSARCCPHLDLFYRTDWRACPVIEHILQSEGWLPAKVQLYQYRCNLEDHLAALDAMQPELPPGFSFFPWSELSEADRQDIRARQGGENGYPPTLDPFQLPGYPVFNNSLGLRYAGRVVGWLVTHRGGPDVIQYTSLFTWPELRSVGRVKLAFAMIVTAIRQQVAQGIFHFIFQVEAHNRPMQYFVRQYFAPYVKVNELRVARKVLESP
jgi:GNAT superfamily N-acetyltransferase